MAFKEVVGSPLQFLQPKFCMNFLFSLCMLHILQCFCCTSWKSELANSNYDDELWGSTIPGSYIATE